jgi:ABC-2 type transport system ATP-binding protein
MFMADAAQRNGSFPGGLRDRVVAVEGLTKRYGCRFALDNMSVALGRGEILGLVGGNGGGKTTTLRILGGLMAPDAGHGSVLGLDLRHHMREIRRHVGYMSQRLSLYAELSVMENLRFRAQVYGASRPRAVADATIEAFDLTAHARTLAGHLSGGWARRLQLAASMIHQPKLLLLDEPMAGLDALTRQEVWRRLADTAAQGVSVIISTHDLAEAEWCTRTILVSAGRVVAAGTPEQVVRGIPAVAFVMDGGSARRLAQALSDLPGVISVSPRGSSLRIVAADTAADRLASVAAVHGTTLSRTGMRLEDAALALLGKERAPSQGQ